MDAKTGSLFEEPDSEYKLTLLDVVFGMFFHFFLFPSRYGIPSMIDNHENIYLSNVKGWPHNKKAVE